MVNMRSFSFDRVADLRTKGQDSQNRYGN